MKSLLLFHSVVVPAQEISYLRFTVSQQRILAIHFYTCRGITHENGEEAVRVFEADVQQARAELFPGDDRIVQELFLISPELRSRSHLTCLSFLITTVIAVLMLYLYVHVSLFKVFLHENTAIALKHAKCSLKLGH